MENRLALIDKKSKIVKSIIIVDSFNDISVWETDSLLPVADENNEAKVYGSWNGKKFIDPSNEYLIAEGLIKSPEEIALEIEKQEQRAALLNRLGITEEEASLLLG